jgi:hypothetical protein
MIGLVLSLSSQLVEGKLLQSEQAGSLQGVHAYRSTRIQTADNSYPGTVLIITSNAPTQPISCERHPNTFAQSFTP